MVPRFGKHLTCMMGLVTFVNLALMGCYLGGTFMDTTAGFGSIAAVGLGVSEFRIAHIAWCFRHGFVFQWFYVWIWVYFIYGYECSGITMANGHGERQGR